MMSAEFVDGAPEHRFSCGVFKDGKLDAFIAPYIAFDPEAARHLADVKKYSKETGLLPVATL